MLPDSWMNGLPESERVSPPQLNASLGRLDLQHLAKVFYRDVPLEGGGR